LITPNPIAATIILIFGLQALVLSVLLLLKRPIRQSNFLLALVLFFFALISVNIGMANFLFSYDLFHVFRYVQLELLFGFGPALYLFTKSITDPDYRISPKEYIHFLPVVLEFIFYRTEIYRLGSNGLYQTPVHPFTIVYLVEQWLGTASISVYVLLSVRVLIKYRQWIKSKYSNLKNKSLGWLRIPVFIYSGYWIVWLILIKIDLHVFQNAFRDFYFLPTNIGLSIITSWIGFIGYIKSQTEVSGFLKTTLKTETIPSNPEEVKLITDLMNTQKPYLNPDLDLLKLSEIAKLNPKITSRIINHDLHMNFYEFVNKHRVEEFKQRLQQSNCDQLSLLGHAFECGFNSKSTFNHIFKKYTQQTPREYYLKFKNESEQKHSDV
jgi:AraC-like DNA-binding protein